MAHKLKSLRVCNHPASLCFKKFRPFGILLAVKRCMRGSAAFKAEVSFADRAIDIKQLFGLRNLNHAGTAISDAIPQFTSLRLNEKVFSVLNIHEEVFFAQEFFK